MSDRATLGSAYSDGPAGLWTDSAGRMFVGPFPSDDHLHYALIDEELNWTWCRSAAGTPADDPLLRVDFLAGMRWIMDRARDLRRDLVAHRARAEAVEAVVRERVEATWGEILSAAHLKVVPMDTPEGDGR